MNKAWRKLCIFLRNFSRFSRILKGGQRSQSVWDQQEGWRLTQGHFSRQEDLKLGHFSTAKYFSTTRESQQSLWCADTADEDELDEGWLMKICSALWRKTSRSQPDRRGKNTTWCSVHTPNGRVPKGKDGISSSSPWSGTTKSRAHRPRLSMRSLPVWGWFTVCEVTSVPQVATRWPVPQMSPVKPSKFTTQRKNLTAQFHKTLSLEEVKKKNVKKKRKKKGLYKYANI